MPTQNMLSKPEDKGSCAVKTLNTGEPDPRLQSQLFFVVECTNETCERVKGAFLPISLRLTLVEVGLGALAIQDYFQMGHYPEGQCLQGLDSIPSIL